MESSEEFKIKTGDIIVVDLGTKPETKGHEQENKRYCVVIKSGGKILTILPCTRTISEYYYTPAFDSLIKDGVTTCVLCNQIRTVSIDRVISKKAKKQLNKEELNNILRPLAKYLGLLNII